jgi:hypothetical protein
MSDPYRGTVLAPEQSELHAADYLRLITLRVLSPGQAQIEHLGPLMPAEPKAGGRNFTIRRHVLKRRAAAFRGSQPVEAGREAQMELRQAIGALSPRKCACAAPRYLADMTEAHGAGPRDHARHGQEPDTPGIAALAICGRVAGNLRDNEISDVTPKPFRCCRSWCRPGARRQSGSDRSVTHEAPGQGGGDDHDQRK